MNDLNELYSINAEGEVRTRDDEGAPTDHVIGIIDKIEDGDRLWQAMTTERVAVGEAVETRTEALANLHDSLK